MKATFEYDLPEDQQAYDIANQASRTHRFLWEFSEQLRNWEKYGSDFKDGRDAVVKIREEFYKLINAYEINIDL